MGLLLQGGSSNIADVQFEGGAGNKTVIIPKEGGKLAVGTMLSGATAYHLLQGDLSLTTQANKFETTTTTTANYTTSDYIFCYADNKLYDCILASTSGVLLTNTTYFTPIAGGTLSINNAIIPFANGIDSNGTKVSTLSKNETITGLTYTAGKNYVYCDKNGAYGVTPYKPRYLESDLIAEKAGDNPDYFDVLKNKWFSTVAASELVTNGDGNSVTGWLNDNGTLSVENGSIKCTSSASNTGYTYQTVNTIVGKTYRMKGTITNVNMYQYGLLISDSVNTLFTETITATGSKTYDITFVAQSTTTNIKFFRNSSAASQYVYIDGVSVYATNLAIGSEITTGRNYLNTVVYADASGQLTYEEELPKTQYFDRIETAGNRVVMYLADYGIAQIQNNKRYVIDNPFSNDRFMDCDTKLEIYDSGISKWIEVGHSVPDNGSGVAFYGAKSFSTLDGLIIQTATNSILYAGASGLVQPYSASSSLTSAPARVTIQFNGKTGRTR